MAFIQSIPVADATGEARDLYERTQASRGYVPNYAKVFSLRPAVMAAWSNLLSSICANLDTRRYELVTLAAARALRSSYCSLAHGSELRKKFYSPVQLAAIARDYTAAGLLPADVAMMAFAERIACDASAIGAADVQVLRDHGFTDAAIFDVAAAAAARCFFSKLLDALGAEPDAAYLQLEDGLRQELVVGRPIGREAAEQLPDAGASTDRALIDRLQLTIALRLRHYLRLIGVGAVIAGRVLEVGEKPSNGITSIHLTY